MKYSASVQPHRNIIQIMKAFRIQHKNSGRGPFQHYENEFCVKFCDKFLEWTGNSPQQHPTPSNDGFPCEFFSSAYYESWRFGCLSMDSITAWFGQFCQYLHENSFMLYVFDFPRENEDGDPTYIIGKSGKQIAFNPYYATVVDKYELKIFSSRSGGF